MSDSRASPLQRSDLDPDPLRQFQAWYDAAHAAGEQFPQAFALATATREGQPAVRMVLLKSADETGFVFYTSYESRKGRELAANPRAALCFYWHDLGRQARIEGAVAQVTEAEADTYFATRPVGSRLSASVSRQSEPVASRAVLEEAVADLRSRGEDVRRPAHWGGYRVAPEAYEFWQHRDDRLHDRFRYTREHERWRIERLAP